MTTMTLPTHRLARTRFDALASGSGDLAGELSAAQLSKRVVQILAVLGHVSTGRAGSFGGDRFAEGYRLVATLRRHSRAAVDTVLGYPQVGAWAAHLLRMLSDPNVDEVALEDDLGHFGAVAAAAALTAGEGFELTLRVRTDGTLMLPTFGLARVGHGPAWCRAWAAPGSAVVRLDMDGTLIELPVHDTAGDTRWWPVRRLGSTTDGCHVEVLLDDVDPYRDCHRLGAAQRLSAADYAGWQASLDQAWTALVRRHGQRARSLSIGLANLVPLEPDGCTAESSASSSDACGSIALTPPADGTTLAVALVHEYQHSKLSALLDLVPLHDAAADEIHYAPWRPDPRPLGGLLHGAYAYLGLLDLWQGQRLEEVGTPSRLAHFEFARWLHAVRRALQSIAGSGRLSPAGDRFVAGMRRRLAELHTLPVPREPHLLARSALADHWTSWRLHNLRPDQDQVAEWADAWLAGVRCPPMRPQPAAVVPGRRWTGAGPRLELAYRRLRDPDRFAALRDDRARLATDVPGAVPADVAYSLGDHPTAARLYREALAGSPDRVDAWAGLALTHRTLRTPAARFLVSFPESVLALHQRIMTTTGVPPDADALASWLDAGHRAAQHRDTGQQGGAGRIR